MKEFEYCVVIGRFSPVHNGHLLLIEEALNKANNVLVLLGSANKAPDIKNPWTSHQRQEMILATLEKEQKARVKFIHINDYLYNDNMWISEVQRQVSEATDDSKSIALLGHDHDKSSYYLYLFPQWKLINIKNFDHCPHATKIRDWYFTYDNSYKNHLHEKTIEYLEEFKKTEDFTRLKNEYDFLKEYKMKWEGAPFQPIFHTVDSVVICSGHVLLVRRKGKLGNGLLALPGGFLNSDERVKEGALRELKEETAIKLSKEELETSIVEQKTFDIVERSLRGRTITSAFLIHLKTKFLPQVKGSDDAEKAFWMPLNEVFAKGAQAFFEDHWHIIMNFCSKY